CALSPISSQREFSSLTIPSLGEVLVEFVLLAITDRRPSGDNPDIRLIAREKELADLNPNSNDISLIAISGCDTRQVFTRTIRISLRRFLNVLPAELRIDLFMVCWLTCKRRESSLRPREGSSFNKAAICSKSKLR